MRKPAYTISASRARAQRVQRFALAAGSLCLLSACAGPPTSVHLSLIAAPRLNPDETGAPNPVQVHVLMLKASDAFTNTDYFQLADKEKTVLGGDLLSQTNEVLRPGQTKTIDLPVLPGAKFVGVSAAYRNIDQATWRVVAPIRRKVDVNAGADALSVVPPPK